MSAKVTSCSVSNASEIGGRSSTSTCTTCSSSPPTWVALTIVGYGLRRVGGAADRTGENFLLAGRSIGTPAFVATLVATWYGGILGIGEFSYSYGVVTFLTQSLFFYVFAVVFALWIAPKARAGTAFTLPDRLEERYGRHAAVVGAVLIYLMVSPAPYLLIVGTLIQVATGWPLWLSLVVAAPLSTWYALTGGLLGSGTYRSAAGITDGDRPSVCSPAWRCRRTAAGNF